MQKEKDIDQVTEELRQSVIKSKSAKHCIRDFSGDIFELTADMLVKDRIFDITQAKELTGIAECILQKYAKLLTIK